MPVKYQVWFQRNQLTSAVKQLVLDESGQDLIEYAFVASLVALAAITSMRSLGTHISASFTNVATTLSASI